MKKSNVIKIEISLPKPLLFQIWDVFYMRLAKLTRCSMDLHITAEKAETELLEISSYIEHFVSRHMQLKILHGSLLTINEQKCLIYQIPDEQERDRAVQNKYLPQEFLERRGFQLEIHAEEMKKSTPVPTVAAKGEAAAKPVKVYEEKRSYNSKPKGKKELDQYVSFSIYDITEECHGIRIHGKIFEAEARTLRNGRGIRMLWIGDDDGAIIMKQFECGAVTKEILAGIKNGDCVIAYDKAEHDAYTRELIFMSDVIEEVVKVERVDETGERRVELHVHTRLSETDGVCDIEEYIDQANAWGVDAIAIIDHLMVQAFPKA